MMSCNAPFGLPIGTVRATLALSLIFGSIYIWITVADIPDTLAVLDGIVIRDYFEQRKKEEAN